MNAFAALLVRDLRLGIRAGSSALMAVLFFLLVVALVPFAFGPDLPLLRRLGPAILWTGALLANLLALDRLLLADHEDGSLDLLLTARFPLELSLVAKGLAHWIATGAAIAVASPLLGLLLDLEPRVMGAIAASLILGTPALTFIGLLGAALSVGLRRGGLLLPILVLPLTAPVLIFGVAAANAAAAGAPLTTPFLVLCALTLFALVLGPFAGAAALRHGGE